ncbi:MAG: rhodanese-like domain-containing protein [Chloroflexi bacterium]|uniref:Rhodanese-like domain-containing protein n=1 Tax=Candidatus Chlorohelix allophototropha TaxID=3003348 RepID=A0A8T7M4J2_9CHLR|nr:rhodanese-like domain-containing protein [Chloroflexota bacterium]WJW70019.1 rhodanese-like domain-containing protein [Chloroflexota bacterium L227-S17]
MFNIFGTKISPFSLISPMQVEERLQGGATLVIDVREPYAYAEWHIKDSKLIPLGQLNNITNLLCSKYHEIIVVCESGNRSHFAAGQLVLLGFTKVANLKGGLRNWLKSGFQVEMWIDKEHVK